MSMMMLLNRRMYKNPVVPFSPLNMFRDGSDGIFWHYRNPRYLWTDEARTQHPENPGDPIWWIDDQSGNENHWKAPNSAARGRWARWPASAVREGRVRNLLTHTEDFLSSPWIRPGSPVLTQGTSDLVGDYTIFESTGEGVENTLGYAISFAMEGESIVRKWLFKPLSGTGVIGFGTRSDRPTHTLVTYDFSTGEYENAGADSFSTVDIGDGWVEITAIVESTRAEITFRRISVGVSTVSNTSVNRFGIKYMAAERGLESHPYQRVGAGHWDVTEEGQPSVWFDMFDGVDDAMGVTLPDISDGTIVLAGLKGIWIDDLTTVAGTFTVGPDTYTGGPAGLLGLTGDLIGGVIIDRALTPVERSEVVQWFINEGSPGELP